MNKIICDICGSTYPETAECCPICGSSREFGIENPDYVPQKMPEYIPEGEKKSGIFSSAVKRAQEGFYDADEPDFDLPMDVLPEVDASEESVQEAPKHRINYFVVILLTIIIFVCIAVFGFLLFRFYLPNHISWEKEPEATETILPSETTAETTEPTVPCTSIVLTSGVPEITRIGQFWLLHVLVIPENTTDTLSYTSSDESVVTVTNEGRLCAVGEGQATIVISCGREQILCQVTVNIPDDPTENTTDVTDSAAPLADAETTAPAEQPQATDSVVLKLKQTDISFNKKGVTFQLELDCDLRPEDISWMTLDPDVAICHNGVITVLGNGTTRIVAQYADQEVYCIVRCKFG